MEEKIEVGARLKEERERLKLSQTAFGQLAGITRNAQGMYESGERMPDGMYYRSIAKAGADVMYILIGENSDSAALSAREVALLDNYRASSADVQKGISYLLAQTGNALERANAIEQPEQTNKGETE